MSKEEHPTIQGLMNEAYARYQSDEGKDWGTEDFYANLDPIQRAACVLGNLNYQVCNGGFYQWWGNGYGPASQPFLKHAFGLVDTELTKKVASLVEQSSKLLEALDEMDQEDWDIEEPEEFDKLDDLDGKFYEINDKWLDEVERCFAAIQATK